MKIQRGVLIRILLVLMLAVIILYSHGCSCLGLGDDDDRDDGDEDDEDDESVVNELCQRYGGAFCENECAPDDINCIEFVNNLNEPELEAVKLVLGDIREYSYSYFVRPAVDSNVRIYFEGAGSTDLDNQAVDGLATFQDSASDVVINEDYDRICADVTPVNTELQAQTYCSDIEDRIGPRLEGVPEVFSMREDELFDFQVIANDPDCLADCALVYSVDDATNIVTINSITGKIRLTPTQADVDASPFDITIRVTDLENEDSEVVRVEIENVNDVPEVDTFDVSIGENSGSYLINNLDLYITDEDDAFEDLSITFPTSIPNFADLFHSGSSLTITPTGTVGTRVLSYTVTDEESTPVTGTIRITVLNENDPPEFTQTIPDIELEEDFGIFTLGLDQFADDPDLGDVLTFAVTGGTQILDAASVEVGNILRLDDKADASGTASLTITLTDGDVQVQDIVALTIIGINDPPEFLATYPTEANLNEIPSAVINLGDHVEDDETPTQDLLFSVAPITPGLNEDLNVVITGQTLTLNIADYSESFIHILRVQVADGVGSGALTAERTLTIIYNGE